MVVLYTVVSERGDVWLDTVVLLCPVELRIREDDVVLLFPALKVLEDGVVIL